MNKIPDYILTMVRIQILCELDAHALLHIYMSQYIIDNEDLLMKKQKSLKGICTL